MTMPYYPARRYRSTRRRPRRYTSRSRLVTYGQIGAKLYKDVSMLKNLINVEFKHSNTNQTTGPDNSGDIVLLNGIAQGDGQSSRDGNQIRLKSVQCNGHVRFNPAATSSQVRLIWFIVKNVQLTAPTVSQVLASADPDALRNLDHKRNIVILKDMFFALDASSRQRRIIRFYRKLDLKTIYANGQTGGAVTDMESGGLFLLKISNEPTNTPTIDFYHRVRYVDN